MAKATFKRLNDDLTRTIVQNMDVNVRVIDATGPGMVQIQWQDAKGETHTTLPMQESSAHFWLKGFAAAISGFVG